MMPVMVHRGNIFSGLICVAMFVCSVSFGQISKAIINYKVKLYPKDSVNNSRNYNLVLSEVDKLEFKLIYSKDSINEQARFVEVIEGVNFNFTDGFFKKRAKIFAGLNTSYYYDLVNEKILKKKAFLGNEYIIIGDFHQYAWKITEESKRIDNYLCQKAISEKKYKTRMGAIDTLYLTAWFATDLPIPLGPKDYQGLPGLILELHECADSTHEVNTSYTKGRTYYVSGIELNVKQPIDIVPFDGENVVTEKEYEKIVEN
ncbi:GLPGLI family protein [Snuella sedimenti]|uniref:GLPGLI family protein n=1 Tax=Snuella sedimenti TaxID=2798802 RepID=A0A8J7LPA0_9FLAO|nr:GLPGLI family protein [Snuella sedimenti]MBJ6369058.1 GLPGLI family protein [Snuella sedimenti]